MVRARGKHPFAHSPCAQAALVPQSTLKAHFSSLTQACDESQECDDQHFGGRFCFFHEPKSWIEAQADCVRRGGQLASIKTQADQDAVDLFLLASQCQNSECMRVWFGLSRTDSSWWWEDEAELSFSHWRPNYNPESSTPSRFDCAHLRSPYGQALDTYYWQNNWPCDGSEQGWLFGASTFPYICESAPVEMWTVDFTFTVGSLNTVRPCSIL